MHVEEGIVVACVVWVVVGFLVVVVWVVDEGWLVVGMVLCFILETVVVVESTCVVILCVKAGVVV